MSLLCHLLRGFVLAQNRRKKSGQSPDFVGRDDQLSQLRALWKHKRAALVSCVGRRRIGKSRLIQEFGHTYARELLEFQGLPPRSGQNNTDQLKNFAEKLARITAISEPIVLNSWTQAFALLAQVIPNRKKSVVLLDEISWMGKCWRLEWC